MYVNVLKQIINNADEQVSVAYRQLSSKAEAPIRPRKASCVFGVVVSSVAKEEMAVPPRTSLLSLIRPCPRASARLRVCASARLRVCASTCLRVYASARLPAERQSPVGDNLHSAALSR